MFYCFTVRPKFGHLDLLFYGNNNNKRYFSLFGDSSITILTDNVILLEKISVIYV